MKYIGDRFRRGSPSRRRLCSGRAAEPALPLAEGVLRRCVLHYVLLLVVPVPSPSSCPGVAACCSSACDASPPCGRLRSTPELDEQRQRPVLSTSKPAWPAQRASRHRSDTQGTRQQSRARAAGVWRCCCLTVALACPLCAVSPARPLLPSQPVLCCAPSHSSDDRPSPSPSACTELPPLRRDDAARRARTKHIDQLPDTLHSIAREASQHVAAKSSHQTGTHTATTRRRWSD